MPLPKSQISVLDFGSVVAPSADEVRAHLSSMLGSPNFVVPARLRQFLSYVVDEALAGRGDRIKAYSIAVEVFGRDKTFDLMNDPVVRIEAGRLRRALERYYLLEGEAAPMSITIPKGGYAPVFRRHVDAPEDVTPLLAPSLPSVHDPRFINKLRPLWLVASLSAIAGSLCAIYLVTATTSGSEAPPTTSPPVSIAVKPFVNLSPAADGKAFAAALTEEVVLQLAPISNLTIFQSEALESLPAASNANARQNFGFHHVLEGAIRSANGKVRITTRLLTSDTAAIVWSAAYVAETAGQNTFDLESSLAAKIAVSAASTALIRSQSSPTSMRGSQ